MLDGHRRCAGACVMHKLEIGKQPARSDATLGSRVTKIFGDAGEFGWSDMKHKTV